MELNDILTDDIINICHNQKIEYKLLRELKDIDTPNDLLNLIYFLCRSFNFDIF